MRPWRQQTTCLPGVLSTHEEEEENTSLSLSSRTSWRSEFSQSAPWFAIPTVLQCAKLQHCWQLPIVLQQRKERTIGANEKYNKPWKKNWVISDVHDKICSSLCDFIIFPNKTTCTTFAIVTYIFIFKMVHFLVIGTRLGNFVLGGLEKLYC